jgi:hypothetical protein
MYSEPAVGLVSLAGRRSRGQNIALPLSYTHHRINRVGDRNRTDNRCTPTGSRRSQGHFAKETANEGIGSDRTVVNVVRTGSWPSETRWESNPLRPGCNRLPGRLAPAFFVEKVSSPGIEPSLRPSQSRVPSDTLRGLFNSLPMAGFEPALICLKDRCLTARPHRLNQSVSKGARI